jgi:hypothetical protein
MTIFLIPVVGFLGALITIFSSCLIGMVISLGMALFSSFTTPSNFRFVALYAIFCGVFGGLAWGGFILSQLLAESAGLTNTATIVGAIFPGIFGLQAIIALPAMAENQL